MGSGSNCFGDQLSRQSFDLRPFELAGLVEVVLHLHASPHFSTGAESLGKAVGHVG